MGTVVGGKKGKEALNIQFIHPWPCVIVPHFNFTVLMRQMLSMKINIYELLCVMLRPAMGSDYVRKETDAPGREIKGS